MYISFTSSRPAKEQSQQLEEFLETFLPRMRKFTGVRAIYHFARPENGEDTTIVIWESEEVMKQYRESELIKEAIAFEKKNKLPSTRESYSLIRSL
jgi:heme-degrading monooxygenase HmoA